MDKEILEITDTEVRVVGLTITRKDVVDYLSTFPAEQRKDAFIRAVEVGVFSLQRATAGQDIESVKRQIDSLLNSVQKTAENIPNTVEQKLVAKIGADNGQVLSPIKTLVERVSDLNLQRLNDVKGLLESEIDPRKETSTIGRVLAELRKLLDAHQDGSVQKSFERAVQQVASQDGALAANVKRVVEEAIKPLQQELDSLAKEVKGQKEAQKIISQTTLKGAAYEVEVLEILKKWAHPVGATIEHVGQDNQTGDILITIPSSSVAKIDLSIIVEVKTDTDGKGKKRITDILKDAMSFRSANAAIFLSREIGGLAQEIGEWAEGLLENGQWIATLPDHLITAVRFLIARKQMEELQKTQAKIDTVAVSEQVKRVRTNLGKITNINTKVTEITDAAESIKSLGRELREDIQDALMKIEQAITSAASS